MLKLFDEFIQHDLECVLLFLRNVRRIEVYEIAADGAVREICSTGVRDEGVLEGSSGEYTTWRTVVETKVSASSPAVGGAGRAGVPSTTATGTGPGARSGVTKTITTTWRILNCPFTDAPSIEVLNRIPKEYHPEEEMRRRKLNQRVRVAAPLSSVISSTSTSTTSTTSAATANGVVTNYGIGYWRSGRLFNGLPLPRANNKKWPIHVDARFAIPPSRQSVRSALEGGYVISLVRLQISHLFLALSFVFSVWRLTSCIQLHRGMELDALHGVHPTSMDVSSQRPGTRRPSEGYF